MWPTELSLALSEMGWQDNILWQMQQLSFDKCVKGKCPWTSKLYLNCLIVADWTSTGSVRDKTWERGQYLMARDTICFLQMCTGHMRKDLKTYPNCSTLFETKHWTRDNILWQKQQFFSYKCANGKCSWTLKLYLNCLIVADWTATDFVGDKTWDEGKCLMAKAIILILQMCKWQMLMDLKTLP